MSNSGRNLFNIVLECHVSAYVQNNFISWGKKKKTFKHQSDFNKILENKEISRLSGRFIVTGNCMHEALKINKKTNKILRSDFQWVAVLNRLKTKLTSGKKWKCSS